MIYLGFSCKYLAFTQYYHSGHKAVDIANTVTVGSKKYPNTNVYMAYEGKIVKNAYASDYGYYVEYEVKDGSDTYLIASGHFDTKSALEVGKTYPRGTLINKMGSTGSASSGKHDHFRVTKNGVRVNPLDYCYSYTDWNVIGTKETATIKTYTPIKITPSVARNESKDQVKTLKLLNVRAGAGTNQTILGQVDAGNIYNFSEIKINGEYTWYKIAEGQWIAQDKDNTYLEVYLKEDEEMIKELQAEVNSLKLRIVEFEKEVVEKDQTILEQKKTISELEAKIEELENRTWLSMFINWIKNLF